VVIAGCLGIIVYLFVQGGSSVTWDFLTTDPEVSILEAENSGVRTPMVGTTLLIALSMLVTVPLALASATYLAEYMDESKILTRIIRVGLEVLASVPSVVFGMFGIALFSQGWATALSSTGAEGADAAFGRSFLVASMVMAVHVLPFVIKVMEEAIRTVPRSYRDAAAGLGLTKWRAVRKVVLPAAAPGLATGVILGMGLVAGDTAIVWMTLGGTIGMGAEQWWMPGSWVDVLRGTGSTLTTFTYFTSPAGEGTAENLAFGSALVLMTLILTLNVAAGFIGRLGSRRTGRR
jgi:phosphate transport system permease protein